MNYLVSIWKYFGAIIAVFIAMIGYPITGAIIVIIWMAHIIYQLFDKEF